MSKKIDLHAELRKAIINGEYKPGEILTEASLAERYGFSRTPVRESLRRLESDGIVQRQGRQLRVHVTTPEEVLESYDCRIELEGMAAQWAARNRTDLDLIRLKESLKKMEELEDHSPSSKVTTNHEFHVRLWAASHNSVLIDLLQRVEIFTRRYPEPTISQPGRWDEAVEEHREMLVAIENRDEDYARKLASAHMTKAKELRLNLIAQETVS